MWNEMMENYGREDRKDNDLFFTCSLIDYDCKYSIPTHWDIGKVYKRLIKMVAKEQNIDRIKALQMVYNSFISEKIDDYNSSVYYENPSYIYECFAESRML